MIATNTHVTWLQTTVIVFDGDEQFRDQLCEQFAEFGVRTRIVYDEDEVSEWKTADTAKPTVFLLPISGLANRLASIRDLRSANPKVKLILASKYQTARYVDLCLDIGANAVVNRFETPERLARFTLIVAAG